MQVPVRPSTDWLDAPLKSTFISRSQSLCIFQRHQIAITGRMDPRSRTSDAVKRLDDGGSISGDDGNAGNECGQRRDGGAEGRRQASVDGDQAHDREHATRSIDWTTVAASAAMLAMVAMQAGSRKAEVQGENGRQLWVRTPAGTTAAVQVQDDDTIEHLRTKVGHRAG